MQGHRDSASKRPTREPSTRWAERNDLSQGGGRGTYSALERLSSRECEMARRVARRRVTECSYYSWESRPTRAIGRADHRGKGHRCLRGASREVGVMPQATTADPSPAEAGCQTRESAVPGNRHAAFGEGPTEKGWATSTSPAAYSTLVIRAPLCVCHASDALPPRDSSSAAARDRRCYRMTLLLLNKQSHDRNS